MLAELGEAYSTPDIGEDSAPADVSPCRTGGTSGDAGTFPLLRIVSKTLDQG